jgi:hypothetical protein
MVISMNNGMKRGRSTKRVVSGRTAVKAKKTFSLSSEALAYLNVLRKDYRSASEALDALIRQKKEQAESERVSASIRNYYDSIGEEEREENRKWGEFVEANLIGE